MTEASFQSVAYLLAALLFILALAGLSKQESARRGNYLGILGMAIALVATVALALLHANALFVSAGLILAAVLVGGLFGVHKARHVQMTEMPQLAEINLGTGIIVTSAGLRSFSVDIAA